MCISLYYLRGKALKCISLSVSIGEALALEQDPSLERIPTEESDSDLSRSNGLEGGVAMVKT
jgi:hypothetical protein